MNVRALFRAVAIPGAAAPYDRATLKIYYPASFSGTDEERDTGMVPVAVEHSPLPIVVIMPGINVGPESYGWLAKTLAVAGIVTVTYATIAEDMPGYVSLSPGLNIEALKPDTYGTRLSASALAPVLTELAAINREGLLAGHLDLDHIVLGGHSAGGTVALLNASANWFPGLCGCFSYGAHSGASTILGWPQDSLMPLPGQLPTLIMGGTQDGCIANSAGRYGDDETSPTARVERTFDEALGSDRGDSYLVLIEGANHFSMVFPEDESTGRPFIDFEATRPQEETRALLAGLIGDFVAVCVQGDEDARAALERTLFEENRAIAVARKR